MELKPVAVPMRHWGLRGSCVQVSVAINGTKAQLAESGNGGRIYDGLSEAEGNLRAAESGIEPDEFP